MTQMQIERLTPEEYSHFLAYADPAYGEPLVSVATELLAYDAYKDNDSHLPEFSWISTLDSTTYPGMTFGYIDVL